MTLMNLVTPKARAKFKVLFNILASKTRFLDINVGLKAQLSGAKFVAMIPMNLVAPKPALIQQNGHLRTEPSQLTCLPLKWLIKLALRV
jgi:hypothetical protein